MCFFRITATLTPCDMQTRLTASPVRVITKGTGAGVGEPNKGQVDGQWSHLGRALGLPLSRGTEYVGGAM